MTREDVNKAFVKVGKLLEKYHYDIVSFDASSYDDPEDIPHITYKGERRSISAIRIKGTNAIFVECRPYWHFVHFNINDIDPDELYTLLQDIYYELNESAEIGDFEMDFLENETI